MSIRIARSSVRHVRNISREYGEHHSKLIGTALYIPPGRNLENKRNYHATKQNDSALIVGGIGILVGAVGAQYALEAYNKYQEQQKAAAEKGEGGKDGAANSQAFGFSSTWFAKNFYDGGFEEKMTKREAALILGVRESASAERIKDAHRRLLPINHPDKGGSAYLSMKINEAKDLLLKGKT
jgi:DnaJ homolog subfamily C member 19